MIVQPTKCPQLEGSSNQHNIWENWIIVQPKKCPQLEGSSNQRKNKEKLDDCANEKMPPIRRF